MEQALYLKQKLQLVITNKMEQQLSLLHMPLIDLEGYLMNEAIENPFIDIDSFNDNRLNSKKRQLHNKSGQEWLQNMEQPQSFFDSLLEQLRLLKLKPLEQEILEYLIFQTDENGYFRGSLEEVCKQFAVSVDTVEKCLYLLQTFEPIGIGARNLQECFLLQLRAMAVRNELAELVVADYFNLLVEKKWKEITRNVGGDLVEIQFVFDILKKLNPRPGSSFQQDFSQSIKPELIISCDAPGFTVRINEALYPTFSFDSFYFQQMGSITSFDHKNYLQEKYQHFKWLQQAVDKRKQTLLKVMKAIIEKQHDFFEKGTAYLKPLTIKDVAGEIGMHESTVSRAVNGKYVHTPHGLFEIKYFFTSSIAVNGSEEISSEVVKKALYKLVENENKYKPLSDQKLVELLQTNDGFNLSRRTVTKYREQLGIPSSSKRKRY